MAQAVPWQPPQAGKTPADVFIELEWAVLVAGVAREQAGKGAEMATRQEQKRLCDMLERFDTAMLVTRADDGALHARPMAMAPVREDGALWFATSLDTLKVHELSHDARVNVTFQKRDSFASLTGVARIVRDERIIEEVWSDSWKTWVGNRGDDTRLACIKIEPELAEFWDAAGGRGDRYVFEPDRGYLSQAAAPEGHDKTRY